jgi:hypothetical protein
MPIPTPPGHDQRRDDTRRAPPTTFVLRALILLLVFLHPLIPRLCLALVLTYPDTDS